MSLSIQYETVEDASMRLKSTVVLYDGVPHYVTSVEPAPKDDIFRVIAHPLPHVAKYPDGVGEGDAIRKYISSKKFDLAPFPMGYLNTAARGACYVTRSPARQQKQGLSSGSFQCNNLPWEYFLREPNVPDMVAGKYPNFGEALDQVTKTRKSVAFHREFCIGPDEELPFLFFIFHKGVKIGMVANGRAIILGKKKCLKELLQENNVPFDIKD